MRDILICTVGTSMVSNAENEKASPLFSAFREGNIKGMTLALLELKHDDRRCGAEINSIHSILRSRYLTAKDKLLFFVSDTDAGRFTGQVLSDYYTHGKNEDSFPQAEYKVIEGLTDDSVWRFRNEGLRNLVRLISEKVKRYGSNRIMINATGGYKAQISFAGMIGQALEIPVCYMHERFPEVIQLPPQPVALDLTFWLDQVDNFFDLEEGIAGSLAAFIEIDERFQSLIDEVTVDNSTLVALSPTGQLFHESFLHQFERQREAVLPKATDITKDDKKIIFEDKNHGKHKGLEVQLKKVSALPYVTRIYTHYYNPKLNEPCRFRKSAQGKNDQVEGIFSNAGATTKYDVMTTATNKRELSACIADLNNLLDKGFL